ncbi:MAG TPA: class I SAM-dependent methyltransferase [Methylomirabilota bacterium]|nr:class I SAM-dependent methyltransferase [Methylomirabilota bacterium]
MIRFVNKEKSYLNMKDNTCVICSNAQSYPICSQCKTDPFLVEEARQKLAKQKDMSSLKHMYSQKFSEIKDVNTNHFWDDKLNGTQYLSDQDGLTKDRVKIASSYIPKQAIKILDVGAGYGFVEELLEKDDRLKIYGIDISQEGVQLLSKRFQGEFKTGIVHKIPYPDKYFDGVLALELLEHIPPSQIFAAYKEIRRVLKDQGTLIVSVPLNEHLKFKKDNPSGHVREYSPALIFTELKLANFTIKHFKLVFAFRRFYTIKKLLQKILWFKWEPNDIVVQAIKL